MTIRGTVFLATLVQDSALSVSGLDREDTTLPDRPFTIVGGQPVLTGRGLKGSAVAMARRFFNPLPRVVSEESNRGSAFRRSAWEFANARPRMETASRRRSGVGISQRTGARASKILYDQEVIPAGTEWTLIMECVRRGPAGTEDASREEITEPEGILGYVLSKHWAEGRCWLGGGVARGLGWCHIKDLTAHRLDASAWDCWTAERRGVRGHDVRPIDEIRTLLPKAEKTIPTVAPTSGWCFRTCDLVLSFGEYKPDSDGDSWGVDMLAVGTHDREGRSQPIGHDRTWARPSWASESAGSEPLATDRAIAMEGALPLLPGSAVRGPLRHAFSRDANRQAMLQRKSEKLVADPHLMQGKVGPNDAAGKIFGTTERSSRVLVRDATAEDGWFAAKLHQHAEDEFTAGSFETAKRDAVRLLKGTFRVQVVIDAPDKAAADDLTTKLDPIVALGSIGHLPIGGHKTRGAGWGRWEVAASTDVIVKASAEVVPEKARTSPDGNIKEKTSGSDSQSKEPPFPPPRQPESGRIAIDPVAVDVEGGVSLGSAAQMARRHLSGASPLGWWCEPAIDFNVTQAPRTFGLGDWPADDEVLEIDEAAFFANNACWRIARTTKGWRAVTIREADTATADSKPVAIWSRPARLPREHRTRFAAELPDEGVLMLREWRNPDTLDLVGYTIQMLEQRA